MRRLLGLGLAAALLAPALSSAYPLDGYPATGIIRLVAYRLAAQGTGRPAFLTEGEMLPSSFMALRLAKQGDFEIPEPNEQLQNAILEMVGTDARGYGIAVLDYSNPARPRYGALNPEKPQQPGSVGKIVVLLGWFQALADLYPDVEERRKFLFETEIVADDFIVSDSHDVPIWSWGMGSVERRPIEIGERANVWTWLDWMASASSNAAASTLMENLLLLTHFGKDYPVPKSEADAWFANTPKGTLARIFRDAMQEPMRRAGLDPGSLNQGSCFTRTGKNRVPGSGSIATAGELLRYVVAMEQGKLADPFSSLEIKKLLYHTDRRIRYASAPALDASAVYFHSGSLYGCKPEKGYECGKFLGNRMNYMNSVVVVESVDREPPIRYAAVVLSNVLRKNSAEVHKDLAARIHRVIESFHPVRPPALPATPATDASPSSE